MSEFEKNILKRQKMEGQKKEAATAKEIKEETRIEKQKEYMYKVKEHQQSQR